MGQVLQILFALADKKRPLVRLLHSMAKYVGGVGVQDHYASDVTVFIGERKEARDPTVGSVPMIKFILSKKYMVLPLH